MKPGIKTTEFWITMGLQLIGVLVLADVLGFTPEQQQQLADSVQQLHESTGSVWLQAKDIVAMLVMGWSGGRFVRDRAQLKSLG